MHFRSVANVATVALLALACGSGAGDDDSAHDASTGGATTGGATTAGAGGSTGGTGGTAGSQASSGAGGTSTLGAGAGGVSGMGVAGGPPGGAPGMGGMDMMGLGGFLSGDGGMGLGGMGDAGMGMAGRGMGRGGRGAGGMGAAGMGVAGMGTAGMPMGMAGSGSSCPASGHVTYTLTKASNPTADQQDAYDLITAAMDKALSYYNCYTNITKAETVTYNTSVETADGNSNGSIRFGGKQYMEYSRAMHEIAHTVGIGTYQEFHDLTVDGIFTGENATATVREYTGNPDEVVHADTNHFWPGGLNYASEAGSEKDVIYHCLMVVAIRKDMGFDP